ncbi:MAG: threonylcarbamoyl-AMP synthase [Nitrospirae bacterium]|nr:threonylcarbamoyl-AMP synthase [Nitrospirota bacterium]
MPGGSRGGVIKIDPVRPDPELFQRAVRVIRSGGLIAYPTETFYGLAVDPFNPAAVERLFQSKGRERNKPITLVMDDIKHAEGMVEAISPDALSLIRKFWPGPLTLLFKCSARLPSGLTGGTGKIGIRIPAHPMALKLLQTAGQSLTATSANLSGRPGATTAAQVEENLGSCVDLILDGGPVPGGLESTIVDATLHPPRQVREGRIPFRDVLQTLGLSLTEDHEW